MKLLRFLAVLLLTFLLTFTLSIFGRLSVNAQDFFPGLSSSGNNSGFPLNLPTFKEGNLELAPIFLDGKVVEFVSAKIGLEPGAAARAQLIHRKLQGILNQMSRYTKKQQLSQAISDSKQLEKAVTEQLEITFSKLNEAFVVLIAFPKNAPPEVVYTITKADAQNAGLPESQIAGVAINYGRKLLIQAWKERQPDYIVKQAQLALKILCGLGIASFSLLWLQRYLKAKSIALSAPPATSQPPSHPSLTSKPLELALELMAEFLEKLSTRQKYTINAFLREVLLRVQILLWVLGIGYICSLFFWTRSLSNFILGITGWKGFAPLDWLIHLGQRTTLGVPLLLLLLVLGVSLINQSSYLVIDYLLGIWVEKNALLSTSSQRYELRAPTLATAFKGLVAAFTYFVLGIIILRQLGALPNTVTIILGVISLGISLGAQNLIKDIINGFLILFQDRYAVGDWIAIDDLEGSVENMNLQMTQLRNLEGELISIPNGTISRVCNKSSEWSQVKFTIEIDYEADIEQAMAVMEEVAQQLYTDPIWQDKLLNSPRLLGVDNLDYTGVSLRLLLKTKPLEQWAVGREYRRRIKKAFDKYGISLGLPRQMVILHNSTQVINNQSQDEGE
jgi:small conductance mechanosensitive channel